MNKLEHPRNVLIAVDVQNDFITGSLAVGDAEQVIDPINAFASSVREHDGVAIFTGDQHPSATPHFDVWPPHCVAGTEGAAFHPRLDVREGDTIISKGMEQTDGYSGWEGVTDKGETLETLLMPRTPRERVRVFIGGLATDYCVRATTLDIAKRFEDDDRVTLFLLRDAIRAVGLAPDDEARALSEIEAAKVLAISSEAAQTMIERTVS